ncbi:MAG: hypothetical protein AAFX90_11995 [Pseudomonadota bacterium]
MLKLAAITFAALSQIGIAHAEIEACAPHDETCLACATAIHNGILQKVVVSSVDMGHWSANAALVPESTDGKRRYIFPDVVALGENGANHLAHAECFLDKPATEPAWITIQFREIPASEDYGLPNGRQKTPRQALRLLSDEDYEASGLPFSRYFALNSDQISEILNKE